MKYKIITNGDTFRVAKFQKVGFFKKDKWTLEGSVEAIFPIGIHFIPFDFFTYEDAKLYIARQINAEKKHQAAEALLKKPWTDVEVIQ